MSRFKDLTEKTGRELIDLAHDLSVEEIYGLAAEHGNKSLAELQWLFGFGRSYRNGASPASVTTAEGEEKILISGCYGTATNMGADANAIEGNIKNELPPGLFYGEDDLLSSRLTILQTSFSAYYAVFASWLTRKLPGRLSWHFVANSGTEAVDNTIRVACYYFKSRGVKRPVFLTAEGSDHGLFAAPLAAGTSARAERLKMGLSHYVNESAYRTFDGTADGFARAAKTAGRRRAALLLSAAAVSRENFAEIAEAAREEKILFIADETQSGATSGFTLCNEVDAAPDIMAIAPQVEIADLNQIGVCSWTDRINQTFLGVEKSLKINHTMGNCPFSSRVALEKAGRNPRTISVPYSASEPDKLRKALAGTMPGSISRFLFCESGAGAVERGLMIAHKWMASRSRNRALTFHGAFHGRTTGSAGATGYPAGDPRADKKKGIESVLFDDAFLWAKFNDLEGVRELVARRPDIGAVLVEPVQGEAGAVVPEPGFLKGLESLCRENGLLFMLDEVQTSFGKLGAWSASELWGLNPDVMFVSKGLTGGAKVPIGAVGISAELKEFCERAYPGLLDELDAPSLTAVHMALTTIERLKTLRVGMSESDAAEILSLCPDSGARAGELTLFENARILGAWLAARMRDLKTRQSIIKDVRHASGLMIGVEFEPPFLKQFNDFFTYFIAANALRHGGGILEPSLIRPTIRIQPYIGLSLQQAKQIVETFETACNRTKHLPGCFGDLIYRNLRTGIEEKTLPKTALDLFKAVEYIVRDYV